MSTRKLGKRHEYNRRQAQAFDKAADVFLKPVPEDVLDRLRMVVDEAGIQPGDTVLDVGTGTGVLLPFILKKHPGRVVACDLSSEMIARAWRRFSLQIRFLHVGVVDIPRGEGPFDAVFCNACFANFYDQWATVRAIHRLLAPEGRLVISHPMGREFVIQLKRDSRELDLRELPPSEESARKLLEPAGFRLLSFRDEALLYLLIARKE